MKSLGILIVALTASLGLVACGSKEAASSAAATAAQATKPDKPAGGASDEHGDAHSGGHKEAREVEMTDAAIASANIELATAQSGVIRESLPLYGVIAPNATQVRQIRARFPGPIVAVRKNVGDVVRQGEVLATIESNESLQRYALISPLSGVVTAREANAGEQSEDRSLFTVADLSTVWVELSLFPRDVARVKVGQTVRVVGASPQQVGEGRVSWVAPFGSSANQTLTARVLLANKDRRWAPGLYVTAQLTTGEFAVPLTVHNAAIQTLDDDSVVFVRDGADFRPRTIALGRSDGDRTEIREGLKAGEVYAARNSFILKAELGKGEAEHEH